MLLSNLTASAAACSTLLSIKVSVIPDSRLSNSLYSTDSRCGSCPAPVPYPTGESKDLQALPLLIDAFVQGSQVVESGDLSKRSRKAELHFLASVFANLTVVRISSMLRNHYLKMVIFSHRPEETFSFLLSLPMFSKVTAAWSIL
jgi:hypothetical protein